MADPFPTASRKYDERVYEDTLTIAHFYFHLIKSWYSNVELIKAPSIIFKRIDVSVAESQKYAKCDETKIPNVIRTEKFDIANIRDIWQNEATCYMRHIC